MKPLPEPQQMIKNKPKLEQRVRMILEEYPPTRGDDVLLYRKYLYLFTNVRLTAQQFKQLLCIPSPESISRARRKVQEPTSEHPKLMPTERTKRKRVILEDVNRAYYGDGQMRLL